MHGGINNRYEVIDKFRASRGSVIFLSSEIGSEGLDLQFCKVLFNYDLPWNPMRIEQRIGRIDRFGQVSDTVTILNFLHKNTIDERIYERLYMRLNLIKNTLGEFEAVLGDETRTVLGGATIIAPQGVPHQITNTGATPARVMGIFPTVDVTRQLL